MQQRTQLTHLFEMYQKVLVAEDIRQFHTTMPMVNRKLFLYIAGDSGYKLNNQFNHWFRYINFTVVLILILRKCK